MPAPPPARPDQPPARPEHPPLPRAAAIRLGIRTILPLSIGALPFGVVFGVTVAESSLAWWEGALASVVVLAGASQLALVNLIDDGAPWFVAVLTALVINARFVLYSAALAPAFRSFPRRARDPLPHLMTDQVAVTAILYYEHQLDAETRRWFWLGSGLFFAAAWWLGTGIGLAFASGLPESLPLGFAVPLTFLALLVPAIRSRPMAVAAVVGAAVTVVAAPLPASVNIVAGAVAGVAAGAWANR